MARQPVLQPNGKLAIYGTIVDNFVALDCTVDQAIESLVTWYGPESVQEIERVVKLCAAGHQVFEWWHDWPERLAWAMYLHTKDDPMVRKAWYRTPNMITRRYIEQFVATCQAESRADELNTELTAAHQRIAELEAQLAAAGDYAGYYAAAYDNYHATGKGHILSFDEWWATPHCPMCGQVELDRGVGEDGVERWECSERDGCGHSWPVAAP